VDRVNILFGQPIPSRARRAAKLLPPILPLESAHLCLRPVVPDTSGALQGQGHSERSAFVHGPVQPPRVVGQNARARLAEIVKSTKVAIESVSTWLTLPRSVGKIEARLM
jgi:hypothetical protein